MSAPGPIDPQQVIDALAESGWTRVDESTVTTATHRGRHLMALDCASHGCESVSGDGHLVEALRRVLAERERELLELKGPCSVDRCSLHYAHSGPFDTTQEAP